jgi:hypothetical protein
MRRERALKTVMALVGWFFPAAIYPVIGGLLDPAHVVRMAIPRAS